MEARTLRQRRRDLGLTQAAMAERLGVDTMTVSRWERGKHPIPRSVALAIGAPPVAANNRHDDANYVANVKLDDVTEYPPFDFTDPATWDAKPTVHRHRFTVHGTDFVLDEPGPGVCIVRRAAQSSGGATFDNRLTAVYWAIIEAAGAWPHETED